VLTARQPVNLVLLLKNGITIRNGCMDQTLGGIYLFVALFLLVLAILWFFLPFAIFGTKDKLNELISETKKTNEELKKLRAAISNRNSSDVNDTVSLD